VLTQSLYGAVHVLAYHSPKPVGRMETSLRRTQGKKKNPKGIKAHPLKAIKEKPHPPKAISLHFQPPQSHRTERE